MIGRRLVALVAILGVAVAGLVLPAAAQTAPSISITNMSPRCIDEGGEGFVSGATNQTAVRLQVFSPTGKVVDSSTTTSSQGGYSIGFGFAPSELGEHEARVTAGNFDRSGTFIATTAQASVYIQVPCRAPTLEFDPTCSTPSTTQVRMTGRLFHPLSRGYFDLDLDGDDAIRLPIDNRGTYSALITTTASSSNRTGRAYDLNQNTAQATWPVCPPTPTTTTTTTAVIGSTTTAAPTTTQPTVIGSTTTTTLPPTIEIPPPTPGATLVLDPPLGPTGFVTGVRGTGFPPGPVELTWSGGIGTTMTIAGLDGTFSARVLVLPRDRLGPRALVATGGGTSTYAAFLVLPSTVKPSGSDVTSINRIRRFNNR